MNDDNSAYRILLAACHDCHERDLLDVLRNGSEQSNSCIFELVYFDLRHATNFFVVFSLLDRLRSGYFSAAHLVPPAATWSRVRHSSVPGQPPLRTRQQPLGASGLAPSQQQKVSQSNSEVEVVLWFLEQALRHAGKRVQVLLVFPEDLGGSATEGPATIWDSVEVRSLSGLSDAQRSSAFMCELTGADQRRPLGISPTSIPSILAHTQAGLH